ncbi:hypothetical protein [Pseudotamlana carrageenivorans]|uniref:Uncharacterized protein n=1 Tax=Pseudotamlana carrageenivorans TaxID=2069432 RepID=A0A2I7SKL7_9FLAO|nr:hypothetical protein [Tamlana carrageenivorans]AUS06458.1 hypothetical protein C1A40_13835 [Tamlana carrageenivorans]
MSNTYKGLEIPPLNENLAEIQKVHCDEASQCADYCEECLFFDNNLELFSKWFNKKRYYGK